jgi:hypothetical protein
MWLNKGEAIRWASPWGSLPAVLEDEGHTLITNIRFDRVFLISGLFYGVEGMRVGGTRKLKISPHLGYRDRGIPGVVPAKFGLDCGNHVFGRTKPLIPPTEA